MLKRVFGSYCGGLLLSGAVEDLLSGKRIRKTL